jgi:hypothetical protein
VDGPWPLARARSRTLATELAREKRDWQFFTHARPWYKDAPDNAYAALWNLGAGLIAHALSQDRVREES